MRQHARTLREAAQRRGNQTNGQPTRSGTVLRAYHLAKFQDAPALALQMGHTTTTMLFAHYREVVTPEAAEAYWGPFQS